MNILDIAHIEYLVLRVPVASVLETMAEKQGIDLTASQIFVPKRVVVFFVSREKERILLTVLIKPFLEHLGRGRRIAYEGCYARGWLIS